MDKTVTLSSSQFRALASETRAGIIKLLQQRNHTLSELSKKLSMAAPTIKQHLAVLQGAELVHGIEEGRKWKYYALTRKGRNIFAAESPTNILIVLGVTAVAMAAMLYWFVLMLGAQTAMQPMLGNGFAKIAPAAEGTVAGAETTAVPAGVETTAAPADAEAAAADAVPMPSVQLIALLTAIVAAALVAGFLLGELKR